MIHTIRAGHTLTLKAIETNLSTDYCLEVNSPHKALKEQGMKTRFEERFEEDLSKIKNSLSKKSGVKTVAKVNERIGRLKQKYPSVHKRYNIDLQTDEQGKKIVQISWDKNPVAEQHQQQSLGRYFLRSNRSMPNEAFAWEAYNTINIKAKPFRKIGQEKICSTQAAKLKP